MNKRWLKVELFARIGSEHGHDGSRCADLIFDLVRQSGRDVKLHYIGVFRQVRHGRICTTLPFRHVKPTLFPQSF